MESVADVGDVNTNPAGMAGEGGKSGGGDGDVPITGGRAGGLLNSINHLVVKPMASLSQRVVAER